MFCLVPCEEVDSFLHCFLGEGWGVGGYVFLEYFLFFIVSHFGSKKIIKVTAFKKKKSCYK